MAVQIMRTYDWTCGANSPMHHIRKLRGVDVRAVLKLNIRDIWSVMEENVLPIKCPRCPCLVTHNDMCGEKSKIGVGV